MSLLAYSITPVVVVTVVNNTAAGRCKQCIGKIYFKYIFEVFQVSILILLRCQEKINNLNYSKYIFLYSLY